MSHDLVLALVGFAVAMSVTPGPNNLLVLTSGLNFGLQRTMPLIGGIVLGFVVMVIAVGIGLGSVLQSSPIMHTAMKVAGVAYMMWLAWTIARSEPRTADDDAPAAAPLSAVHGASIQWVNPKAWATALTATAAFLLPGSFAASLAWISAVFAVVAVASLALWAAFGALMRGVLDTPGRVRAFNLVMAALLVASTLPIASDLLAEV